MDDSVVGVFDRERLSDGLVALHRAGYGPQARVLDPARGDLAGQLRRLGVAAPLDPVDQEAGTALIVVSAPGRAPAVAEALERAGARAIRRVSRDGPAFAVATPPTAPGPARPRGGRPPRAAARPRRTPFPASTVAADGWAVPDGPPGDEAPAG